MNPTRFLLIEDDPDHAALICAAIGQARAWCEIQHAASGEAALEILSQQKGAKPDVLLLDVNLPGIGGLQVLEKIKADPRFETLPVVMLTTSNTEADLQTAYRHHANSYVIKPTDYTEMKRVMNEIAVYWTGVNAHSS